MEEIYAARLLLERESFRLAAIRHTPGQLAAMRRRNIARMERARSLVRVSLLDIEFHELIVEAANHARLAHLWAIMKGQIQIFTASLQRQLFEIADDVQETSVATHLDCLRVIASGDAARAEDRRAAASETCGSGCSWTVARKAAWHERFTSSRSNSAAESLARAGGLGRSAGLAVPAWAMADDDSEFFDKRVRPILAQRCESLPFGRQRQDSWHPGSRFASGLEERERVRARDRPRQSR